jgi:predicted ferric reductase
MSAQLWQQVTWDVARASGMVAYILLTLSVAVGLALSMRWQRLRWPRLFTNEMHRYLTLLSLVFIAVHVLAISVDPYIRFGWRDILVPFAASYRPVWVAAGIVGLYLMLAIWISTQLRARIGYAWWRRLHTLTFLVFVLSAIHGLATGTDTRQPWALEIYAGSVLLVAALLINRLLTPIGARGRPHIRLAALVVLMVVGGTLWVVTGPAHAGWSAIAARGL